MTDPQALLAEQAAEVVGKLTGPQRDALWVLPLPRAADPVRWIPGRSYSSLWRKASGHWPAILELESLCLVERTVSRGETLWRPTKPLGLACRAILIERQGK